jgi:hypothetical protein
MPTKPADPTPPEVDTDGASTAPDPTTPPEAELVPLAGDWSNWAYAGPDRIYTAVPVTVTTGAILHWYSNPGLNDGCWTTTDQPANTLPDNWRPEPTEAEAAKLRGDAETSKEG